jgi:hypothetical protein
MRGVSAADIEKAKAGLAYGIPIPGRKGMVTSSYLPEEDKYIDVTDFASGSVVKDPYTGKFFLVRRLTRVAIESISLHEQVKKLPAFIEVEAWVRSCCD